jgi:antirestriction protein ArdC
MAKLDLYQVVTDQIIAAMEAGTTPWQKSWDATGGASMGMPRRVTGEYYRGINVILLWIAAASKGYTADQWMTFNQAKNLGGCVRKGEKGTQIVFFNMFEKENAKTGEMDKIPFLKSYTVFNVEQIDGLPEKFAPAQIIAEPIDGPAAVAELESFFKATGAKILTKGNQPLYRPSMDQIEMPAIEQFHSANAYYGVLAHECIHWTGAAHRIDRLSGNSKEDYAFEELIAEMGSVFVCSIIGAEPNFTNTAAYLNSWLTALRNDKKYIFRASTAAQKASDYLLDAGGHAKPQADDIAA